MLRSRLNSSVVAVEERGTYASTSLGAPAYRRRHKEPPHLAVALKNRHTAQLSGAALSIGPALMILYVCPLRASGDSYASQQR